MKMPFSVQTSTIPEAISIDDFAFQKLIGKGAYGSVFLTKNIYNNKEYAIKVLDRQLTKSNGKSHYIEAEITALHILSGFAINGDINQYLCEENHFSLDAARYYAAELLLGLEQLHSRGIIHRDLKPENILLDENWHIRITDFGLAKVLGKQNNETVMNPKHLIGTLEYISPEVLNHSEALFASDLWAFGCIIYQMVSGRRLFDRYNGLTLFEIIEDLDWSFERNFDASAKDLVKKLLVIKPERRLGALDRKPYQSIREHKFFCGINWNDMGKPPKITPNDRDSSKSKVVVYNNPPGFNRQILDKLYAEAENGMGSESGSFDEVEGEMECTNEEDSASENEVDEISNYSNLVVSFTT